MSSVDKQPKTPKSAAEKPVAKIISEQASVLQDETKAQVRAAVDEVQTQAQKTFEEGRRGVAAQIESVASALRGGGEALREHRLDAFAVYPEDMARRAEDVSVYLRERDAAAMRRDFERTLEREPALALGGLVALGATGVWYLKTRRRGTRDGVSTKRTVAATVPTTPTSTTNRRG